MNPKTFLQTFLLVVVLALGAATVAQAHPHVDGMVTCVGPECK